MAEKLVLAHSGLDPSANIHDASTNFDQTWPNGFLEIFPIPKVEANSRSPEHYVNPIQCRVAPRAARQTRRAK